MEAKRIVLVFTRDEYFGFPLDYPTVATQAYLNLELLGMAQLEPGELPALQEVDLARERGERFIELLEIEEAEAIVAPLRNWSSLPLDGWREVTAEELPSLAASLPDTPEHRALLAEIESLLPYRELCVATDGEGRLFAGVKVAWIYCC